MKDVILCGSALKELKKLADCSVDCCVTSPPYYQLRNYNHPHQLGLEKTPELFVRKLVAIFKEVNRVMKERGTLWIIIGDSYAGSGKAKGDLGTNKDYDGRTALQDLPGAFFTSKKYKPKDLIGIPWMVAFALRAAGWYLRQDIIWNKENPMPESVTDRCTKAHEYIFLFSKSRKYYYNHEAIKTLVTDATIARMAQQIEAQKGSSVLVPGKKEKMMKAVGPGKTLRKGVDTRGGNQGTKAGIAAIAANGRGVKGHSGYFNAAGELMGGGKANKKSVWTVNSSGYRGEHFAVYPEELIVDCIKAGCPEGGIVLDPFFGSGTTGIVARKLDRHYIGIELSPDTVKEAKERMYKELGMFGGYIPSSK